MASQESNRMVYMPFKPKLYLRDAEPVLVAIEPLYNASISNNELNEILVQKEIKAALTA